MSRCFNVIGPLLLVKNVAFFCSFAIGRFSSKKAGSISHTVTDSWKVIWIEWKKIEQISTCGPQQKYHDQPAFGKEHLVNKVIT